MTVEEGSEGMLDCVRDGGGEAVRKFVRADMAPGREFALRGIIVGGGRGPVYGIRMRGLFIALSEVQGTLVEVDEWYECACEFERIERVIA